MVRRGTQVVLAAGVAAAVAAALVVPAGAGCRRRAFHGPLPLGSPRTPTGGAPRAATPAPARPTTPRFDALARAGVLFDDAVSTSSWTLPAHLSMLTGVDPGRHGGVDMRHGFNRSVPTVPALLRAAGFATRAVTSHLYVSSVYGLDDGFEHLDFRQDRKATEVADRGIDLLDRVGDRPFFVFLHLYDPHWHYDPPDWARRLFENAYAGSLTRELLDFSLPAPAAVD